MMSVDSIEVRRLPEESADIGVSENIAELSTLLGYSEVPVRILEHRNAELQLTNERLLRTNRELVDRSIELQSLFDNLDAVFFSVDVQAERFLQISPSVERVLGFPPEAFSKSPALWKEVVLPADWSQVDEAATALRAGSPWHGEYRVRRVGEGTCWVLAKLKPFLNDGGTLLRIDGVITDITVRKQLETQLLQSQKLAAIGRLAGGVAHDFNNLLTAILGFGDLALEGLDRGNVVRREIEEIIRAGERACGLTTQLLVFEPPA
jgi:PAS domain S-box-containing protein